LIVLYFCLLLSDGAVSSSLWLPQACPLLQLKILHVHWYVSAPLTETCQFVSHMRAFFSPNYANLRQEEAAQLNSELF